MEDTEKDPIPPETIQEISLKAGEKARNSRWDLNIAIFLFAVLICVIILVTFTNAGPEIAAPAAAVGLSLVWFTGWRRGKQLYRIYYTEEINRVKREFTEAVTLSLDPTIEQTLEEQVQQAFIARIKNE